MSLTEGQKQRVRERAHDCCEYCRVAQASRMIRFQVDHIIAVSHGGTDDDATMMGITPEGRTTLNVLCINDDGRVTQRLGNIETDEYPCQKE
jgi:hypothetical protein